MMMIVDVDQEIRGSMTERGTMIETEIVNVIETETSIVTEIVIGVLIILALE